MTKYDLGKHDGHVFTNAFQINNYWDGADSVIRKVWCLTCGKEVYIGYSEITVDYD